MSEFGPQLRDRRLSAGMSLATLASTIHYSKGYVSKVENRRVRPTRSMGAACDNALDAKGELLALVDDPVRVRGKRGRPGPRGLPNGPRRLVGRDAELAAIAAALLGRTGADACLVHGMPGVGKTAAALVGARAAERDFPDGCIFLDLHGHTPGVRALAPAEALRRLLRLLDVPDERIPGEVDDLASVLRDRLRGHRVLLVLDNAGTAGQVLPLLPGEPGCRVLITSRDRLLALDDVVRVPVGVLPRPDAVELFRSDAGPSATSDELAVVEHCGLLPLAVRIAAARVRGGGWTVRRLLDRLAEESLRLPALDDGERSVTAAFAATYTGLPADQRRMFGLLALHPHAAAEVPAMQALAGVDLGETERLLDRLHDAHLVERDAAGRVELHALLRVFAGRRALAEIPAADRSAATARLADHLAGHPAGRPARLADAA